MLKNTTRNFDPRGIRESMLAASRQVWLAGLGAAAVTREWVQHEAGHTMRSLVREGTEAESRAIRFVGNQIEASVSRANTMIAYTRRTVESTVKHAAGTTVALAQQVLPRVLPSLPKALPALESLVAATIASRGPKRAKKAAPARRTRVAKKAATTKRGSGRTTRGR